MTRTITVHVAWVNGADGRECSGRDPQTIKYEIDVNRRINCCPANARKPPYLGEGRHQDL